MPRITKLSSALKRKDLQDILWIMLARELNADKDSMDRLSSATLSMVIKTLGDMEKGKKLSGDDEEYLINEIEEWSKK